LQRYAATGRAGTSLPRFRSFLLATLCVAAGYVVGFAVGDDGKPADRARIDVTKALPAATEWTADARKNAARYADASMLARGHEVYVVTVGNDSEVLALLAPMTELGRVAAYSLAREFDFEKLAAAGFTTLAIDSSPDPYEISVTDSLAAGMVLGPSPKKGRAASTP
jgi:hypothetical protein